MTLSASFIALFLIIGTACFGQDSSAVISVDSTDTAASVSASIPDSTRIDTDSAILHMQIDELYEAAKTSFVTLKVRKQASESSKTVYISKLELLGSDQNQIEMDKERSHVFHAVFDSLNLEEATLKKEKLTQILYKRLVSEGYQRNIGSDFKFYQYQLNTVEFASDNIDELGKHPSFRVGIISNDDGTYSVLLNALDPLWK